MSCYDDSVGMIEQMGCSLREGTARDRVMALINKQNYAKRTNEPPAVYRASEHPEKYLVFISSHRSCEVFKVTNKTYNLILIIKIMYSNQFIAKNAFLRKHDVTNGA